MGEPVVLQQAQSPLAGLATGVAQFIATKRKQKLQQAATDYQHGQDKIRNDQAQQGINQRGQEVQYMGNADARQQALQPGAINQQNAQFDATRAATALAIQEKQQNAQLFSLKKQLQELEVKFKTGEVHSQAEQFKYHQLQTQIAQGEAAHQKTALALQDARDRASIRQSDASTNASNASATHENAETGLLGQEAPYMVQELKNDAQPDLSQGDSAAGALGQLSQAGLAYLRHASNGQANPAQAAIGARVQRGLTPQDRQLLPKLLLSGNPQINAGLTNSSLQSKDKIAKDHDEISDRKEDDARYKLFTNGPLFQNLPANVKQHINDQFNRGVSLAAIKDGMSQDSSVDPTSQSIIQKAL